MLGPLNYFIITWCLMIINIDNIVYLMSLQRQMALPDLVGSSLVSISIWRFPRIRQYIITCRNALNTSFHQIYRLNIVCSDDLSMSFDPEFHSFITTSLSSNRYLNGDNNRPLVFKWWRSRRILDWEQCTTRIYIVPGKRPVPVMSMLSGNI